MIISISRLGLCSLVSLATGQLLEHLPHWMHRRMPLPRGVFATSPIKPRSSSLKASFLLIVSYGTEKKHMCKQPNIFLALHISNLAQKEKGSEQG